MPIQSDSLFSTVKQGSQLYKESGEAVSGLAAKAGMPKAPSTPLETAVIGGTPSQSKMAGTPAALKGQAVKPKLPTSLLLATQQRREQIDPTLTQAQDQAAQLSQRLQGLGSLGQRVPQLISKGVSNALNGIQQVPTINEAKLAAVPQDQKAGVVKALGTLQKIWNPQDPTLAGKTPEEKAAAETQFKQEQRDAAALVANATGRSIEDLEKTGFQDLLQEVPTSLNNAIDSASLNQINLGDLEGGAAALGYDSWDLLADDLGIQIPEGQSAANVLTGLTVKELGEAVDSVKRRGFQTQQDWLAVLQDPTASPSDRSIARKILQQMGASGVREAEASVAQLAEQVQASNTVTVNLTGTPQKIQIQDILKNENLKAAVAILLDPNNKSYAAVKAANPDLAAWVEKNQTQLQGISTDVTQDAKDLADINAKNANLVKSIGLDEKTQDRVAKVIFGDDWGKLVGKELDFSSAPLLASLNSFPPAEKTVVTSALAAIADGGTDEDIRAFVSTTRDNLIRLGLNTTDGLTAFRDYWSEMKLIRSIGNSSTATEDSVLFDLTGVTKPQLDILNKENYALGSLGIYTDIVLPSSLQDALNRRTGPTSIDALLKASSLPPTLRQAITSYNQKVSDITVKGSDVTRALANAVLQSDGMPSKQVLTGVANQVTSGKTPAEAIKSLEVLEIKTGSRFADLKNQFATDQINQAATAAGLTDFDSALQKVGQSGEDALNLLNRYRQLQSQLPTSGPVYELYQKKLAALDSGIANLLASRGAGTFVVGQDEGSPMYTATGRWG